MPFLSPSSFALPHRALALVVHAPAHGEDRDGCDHDDADVLHERQVVRAHGGEQPLQRHGREAAAVYTERESAAQACEIL